MNNIISEKLIFPEFNVGDVKKFIKVHRVDDKKNYTMWISVENDDDVKTCSFDINIWDDDNNERSEDLEVGHILTYNEALDKMKDIVNENTEINFIRISNMNNTR